MTIHEEPWPQGTPSWVDVMVDDADAARAFYTQLFGWTAAPGPPEYGGYTMCLLEGSPVAGASPQARDLGRPERVVDLPGGGRRRRRHGPGHRRRRHGRPAADERGQHGPDGLRHRPLRCVVRRLAGRRTHTGVHVANEPGSLVWNELITRDYAAAQAFYAAVFGYGYEEIGDGENFTYSTIARPDGHVVAGIGALDPNMPAEVPSRWVTYFGVADTDAAAAHAQQAWARPWTWRRSTASSGGSP